MLNCSVLVLVLTYYYHCLQVHRGFYTAYHNTTIRPAILDAVERAKKFYGDIEIIAQGHSMGGATTSFCGLFNQIIYIYIYIYIIICILSLFFFSFLSSKLLSVH